MAEEETKFDFESDFQTHVAALYCRDNNFAARSEGLIKPEYFDDYAMANMVAMAISYQAKFGEVPRTARIWASWFKDCLASKLLRRDDLDDVGSALKTILKSDISGRSYALEKVSVFARNQALQSALIKSVDLMERSDFDAIEEVIGKALRVGAEDDVVDYDYWDTVEQRSDYREEKLSGKMSPTGIPTGIKKLDNLLYHEGFGRKELSAFMGGAKKGKSMALGYFASRVSMSGYNVLYVTLEVSTSIIADRTDAAVTHTDMSMIAEEHKKIAETISSTAKARSPGKYKIIGFPSGTLSPRQLERVIDKYRAEGISFDMVVVDYADIMAPDRYTGNPIDESKQVWLGLRAIADKNDLAMVTATQTNREGFKEATAKAEHAAEDFNKVRIADLIISINRTDEETEAGEARLYFAANRNGAGEFTLHITQDLSKMLFIKSVKGVS